MDFRSTLNQLVTINHIQIIQLAEIQFIQKIGEGGQAKVYKASYKSNIVAVKVMRNIDYKCFAHELVIIAYMTHPNIPKFYGIILEEEVISIVSEFIDGTTLNYFNKDIFNIQQKLKMIYDLSSILEYMHQNKFIHRDLKPENLMITKDCKIYLIDFGIAKICTKEDYTKTRAKGTINYLAPEVLEPSEINGEEQIISKITTKVDVWAFGCIVSWLFSGYTPWTDKYKDLFPIIQQILIKKLPFSIPKNIDANSFIYKIIQNSTQVDPDKRASMAEIKLLIQEELVKNGINL